MVMLFVIMIIMISGFLASIACIDSLYNQNKVRRNYIIFVSVILILQSGLRNLAVGPDTYAYYLKFNEINIWNWNDVWMNFSTVYIEGIGKDAGFTLLLKIFQIFFNNFRIFLFFIAVFFFGAFGKFVYHNTNSILNVVFAYTLYLALFYEFFSVTGIRQTIATSIVLYGFSFVQNKKFLWFLFCCFIAFFIHKSVVIFVLVYLLYWFRGTKQLYIIGLISILFMFMFRQQIIAYTKFFYYGKILEDIVEIPFNFIAIMMAFFIFIMYSMKRLKLGGNKKMLGLCNIALVGFLLAPTIGRESGTMRIIQYFSIFLVVLMPAVFDVYDKKLRKIFYIMSISLFLFIAVLKSNYAFFWQPMKLGPNYGIETIIQE